MRAALPWLPTRMIGRPFRWEHGSRQTGCSPTKQVAHDRCELSWAEWPARVIPRQSPFIISEDHQQCPSLATESATPNDPHPATRSATSPRVAASGSSASHATAGASTWDTSTSIGRYGSERLSRGRTRGGNDSFVAVPLGTHRAVRLDTTPRPKPKKGSPWGTR